MALSGFSLVRTQFPINQSKFTSDFDWKEKNNTININIDFDILKNSKLINRFDDITDNKFENSTKISVGGFYIPKYDSFSSYLSRVVYRAGFRYENTGLVFNNNSINDYGMNFGLGLPVGLSKIDLGFEFGKRGTTTNGLIEENYFNVSVGLSLSDIWFNKRKID